MVGSSGDGAAKSQDYGLTQNKIKNESSQPVPLSENNGSEHILKHEWP